MGRVLGVLLLLGVACDRNADPGYLPPVVPDQHCGDDGAMGIADDGCRRCVCMKNVWTCDEKTCTNVCAPGAKKQVSCSRCNCTAQGSWQCERSACLGRVGPR